MGDQDNRSVLVVDDEETIVELISEVLRAHGMTVYTAGNGTQALTMVEEHRPDIVLTDIRMPGCLGTTFLRDLSARPIGKRPRVFVATAYGDLTASDARDLGVQGILQKPFDLDDLVDLFDDGPALGRVPKLATPSGAP